MRVVGVVSEYNPFHNGHEYHLRETKAMGFECVVGVMSGSFVQRGEIACYDKWTRTKVALMNGVNLCVELPTVNVLGSAKRFAEGAVWLLGKMKVDGISFGSELGNVKELVEIAECVSEVENSKVVKDYISNGMSFPKALSMALNDSMGKEFADIINNPNNLLGIEYIKAVKKFDLNMELYTVKREQAEHDSMNTGVDIASATYIRSTFADKMPISTKEVFLPKNSIELYESEIQNGTAPMLMSGIEKAVLIKLRQMTAKDFLKIADVSNGLENRLVKSAKISKTLDEFYHNVKNKSITLARVRRITMNAFLDIDKEMTNTLPEYGRVLGMDNLGKEVLKSLKKSDFLISPKFSTLYNKAPENVKKILDCDIKATDISMVACDNIQNAGLDFIKNTIIL